MLETLASLLAFGAIALACFGLGRPLMRTLRLEACDGLTIGVWSLSLGALAAGTLFLTLAIGGVLCVTSIAALTMVAGLWGLAELSCIPLAHFPHRPVNLAIERDSNEHTVPGLGICLAIAGLGALASFIQSLAPPTDTRAMVHSLAIAKQLLLDGSWNVLQGTPATLPRLDQLLALWGLALDGPVAASLVNWGVGLLAALATALAARPMLGGPIGMLAGALVMLCPGMQMNMSVPLDGTSLVLFTALSCDAMWRVSVHGGGHEWRLPAAFALFGNAFAGDAGLLLSASVALLWARAILGEFSHAVATRRVTWGAGVIAVALLAAALSWQWIGNNDGDFVQALFSLFEAIGPLLLVLAPGILFARKLRGLRQVTLLLASYAVLATLTPGTETRWMPLVPILSVLAAWVASETNRFPWPQLWALRFICLALALGVTVPGLGGSLACFRVALGFSSRDDYLSARVPTYRAASLVNSLGQPGLRI